jgi:hypothetical protein
LTGADIFDRKITKRVQNDDGTEDVTFECGHEAVFVIPSVQDVYACAQCINDYVEKHRQGKLLDPADPQAPKYWMNETSGVLRPAVEAYINLRPMTAMQIGAMRAYLRQWIQSPVWKGFDEEMADLRRDVETIRTREDISAWLHAALDIGQDPL